MKEPSFLVRPSFRQWLRYAAQGEPNRWGALEHWFLVWCHCDLRACTQRGVLDHLRRHGKHAKQGKPLGDIAGAFLAYETFVRSGQRVPRIAKRPIPIEDVHIRKHYSMRPNTLKHVEQLRKHFRNASSSEVVNLAITTLFELEHLN